MDEKKVKALKVYDNVIRPLPHPRSETALFAKTIVRGTQCGCEFAEAFECVYRVGV